MRTPCIAAVLAAAVVTAPGVSAEAPEAPEAPGPVSSAGSVHPGYSFHFPRDHFGHPEFESEWWYYTGNLFAEAGRHFGFELTFFRRARTIDTDPPSAWDLDQVHLAHFIVTDTDGERFVITERLNRAGPGIAGADAGKRRIWNGNWSIEWRSGDEVRPVQALTAMSGDAALRLVLEPRKPVVVHGRDGVSRKVAGDPRAVSHYLSFTRMAATGTVTIDGEDFPVTGQAWMDHEFFSDHLTEHKVGWDWMSIQLDDGADVMLFGIRDAQGRYGPDTFGTFVDAGGGAHPIEPGGVEFRPGRRWRSDGNRRGVPGGMAGGGAGIQPAAERAPSSRCPGGLHRERISARVLGRGGAFRRRASGTSRDRGRLPGNDGLRRCAGYRRHRRIDAGNEGPGLSSLPEFGRVRTPDSPRSPVPGESVARTPAIRVRCAGRAGRAGRAGSHDANGDAGVRRSLDPRHVTWHRAPSC